MATKIKCAAAGIRKDGRLHKGYRWAKNRKACAIKAKTKVVKAKRKSKQLPTAFLEHRARQKRPGHVRTQRGIGPVGPLPAMPTYRTNMGAKMPTVRPRRTLPGGF